MIARFKSFMIRVFNTIKKPEMRILPGQLAFFLLLSIIPIFALVGMLAVNFSLSIENLTSTINQSLPKEVAEFIIDIIQGKSANINIIIFSISAFILASNGPHSMIIASNMVYKVKDKDLITRRLKAIFMTVILVLLFIFMLVVPVFGDKIIALIIDFIKNQTVSNSISNIYGILKYPTSLLFIYFCIKLLYTLAPDAHIRSKHTTIGAAFTTIGWIISTEIYSFYVSYFARYNLLYGSVANLIILFLWIYILSYIFVSGIALNASTYETEFEKIEE